MSTKTKIIHSKERNMILKVLNFFEEEAKSKNPTIPINQAQKRAAAATGVSLRTIARIKKESLVSSNLKSPGKRRRPQKNRNVGLNVDDFDLCVIRQTVSEFYKQNRMPTLNALLPAIKEKIDFPWKKESLRRIMHKIGFRWKRCEDKRKISMERHDIVHWRYKYLREVRQYRNDKRPIIYLDETWIDSNLCFGKCWQLGKIGAYAKKNAGNRLIVVHAGNENGFVQGASLIFKSGTNSGDYHGQMNFDNFSKWLKEKLLPNIPDNSVICMDNAPYHTKILNKIPSKNATKKELSNWLTEKQIPHNIKMRKIELYDLVVSNAPPTKKYCVDEFLKEKGHDVLRIPPYHCHLNAIEFAWATIKLYIRGRNVNSELNLTEMYKLTTEALSCITINQWSKYCERVIKAENEYWETDNIVEQKIENISFVVGDEHDSSTETDVSDMDYDSDSTLSGIEML